MMIPLVNSDLFACIDNEDEKLVSQYIWCVADRKWIIFGEYAWALV